MLPDKQVRVDIVPAGSTHAAGSEAQFLHCHLKERGLCPSLCSSVEVLLARKALLPPLVGSSAPEHFCLCSLPQNLHLRRLMFMQ